MPWIERKSHADIPSPEVVLRFAGERSLGDLAGILSDDDADAPGTPPSVASDVRRTSKRPPTTCVGASVLLDTSFLIDLMEETETAVEKARKLECDLVPQRLSAMTLFELYYGIARAADAGTNRETVECNLASKLVHPADADVMRKPDRLAGELENTGTSVGDGDVIIGRKPRSSRSPSSPEVLRTSNVLVSLSNPTDPAVTPGTVRCGLPC